MLPYQSTRVITFPKVWEHFLKILKGINFFLSLSLNHKAKFRCPSAPPSKKKKLSSFAFFFPAVLAKVKPSVSMTSRSLPRSGFHFSIAAISQGMYKRLQGDSLGCREREALCTTDR